MAKDDDDFVKEIEAMANETQAPKKEEPRKRDDRKRATVTRLPSRKPLQPRIENFYVGIGMMLVPIDQTCGLGVAQNAPTIAAAWNNLAEQNPRVKQALERILSGGAWGEVMMAHMPLLMIVLSHHKMLPPGLVDAMTPKKEEPNAAEGNGSATKPA